MKKIILSLILMVAFCISVFGKTLTLSDFDNFSRSVYVYDKNLYDNVTNFLVTNLQSEPSRLIVAIEGDNNYISYVRNTIYNYCDGYLDEWYFINYDVQSNYSDVINSNFSVMVLDRREERKVKTKSSGSGLEHINQNQNYYDSLNKQVYDDLNKLRKINPDVIVYEILTSSFDHYENIYYVSMDWASDFGYSVVMPSENDNFKDYETVYNYKNSKNLYYLLFCRKDIIIKPKGKFYILEQ